MGVHALVRLKGFQELAPVEQSLKKFLSALEFHPKKKHVSLLDAQNRVLAVDVIAKTNLPRTNRSAVDGYAVNSRETAGATQSKPKIFKLTKNMVMGKNQAKQVWTGNTIPEGSDSVVMLENTKMSGKILEVWNPTIPWENVSRTGEDIRKGEVAAKARTRLKPHHLGLIAALGVSKVEVFERPKIAVLATGNELAVLGSKAEENQVYDSNRISLTALCNELGAEIVDLGIAKDDRNEISEKLKIGLRKADAVMTSGGTSVGGLDLVPEVVSTLGKPGVLVHGVAMRPGMPTALAVVEEKPLVILPGNPVAAMLGFEIFCRPLLSRMLGFKDTELRPMLMAKMNHKVSTALGRKNLVRVRVSLEEDEFVAEPISARGSSMLSTMTRANGYIIVPENREGVAKGETVTVHIFEGLEAREDRV
jgi:molybdopterin molybdotransferase